MAWRASGPGWLEVSDFSWGSGDIKKKVEAKINGDVERGDDDDDDDDDDGGDDDADGDGDGGDEEQEADSDIIWYN